MATSRRFDGAVSPILVGTVFVYCLVLGAYLHFHDDAARPLEFSTSGLQNVGQTVGPLVAIAAFIERAVEIVIASTRGLDALELQRVLDGVAATDVAEKDKAQRALDGYKRDTQRYSFCISLALSLGASLVGVRAVSPLLAPSPAQLRWFDLFDVCLTSLLLSGGSDGIHQVVTTITTSLDKIKSKGK